METEFDQQALKREQTKKEIAYWNEVLQKSEKYERLSEDSDFKLVLKDLEETSEAHQAQIDMALASMSELDSVKLQEAFHVIFIHQMKKEYVDAAIDRPRQILELAKTARKNIPELEDQLKNLRED